LNRSKSLQITLLTVAFGLSNAFRTIPTIAAGGIAAELHAGPTGLALFGGAFHWGFALMQIPIGIALDMFGPRRIVVPLSCVAIAGAIVCALAPNVTIVCLGQAVVGIGCAPPFMAALVFTARHWPPRRFARISGAVLAAGGAGMLLTATPLAWLVERTSWRAAFIVLAVLMALVTLACMAVLERSETKTHGRLLPALVSGFAGLRPVLTGRRPLALTSLGLVCYGTAIAIRGLWLVPMFVERHGLTLIAAGNVALGVSVAMIVAPAVVGRIDPGERGRTRLIVGMSFAFAATVGALAFTGTLPLWVDVALTLVFGFLSAYVVLAYAEVRSSYPPELTGRGLTAFNMVLFIGAALAQSLSGAIGSAAQSFGFNAIDAVLLFLAVSLAFGTAGFAILIRGTRGWTAEARI
jgi:MFS family permease